MQRIDLLYTLLFAQIEAGLREGVEKGLVREDLDPRIAAQCYVGSTERVIQQALLSGGPHDLDHIAEQIVDFQSLGVLSPGHRDHYAQDHSLPRGVTI